MPKSIHQQAIRNVFVSTARLAPILALPVLNTPQISGADSLLPGESSYSTLGDMKICKLINGMWQVSGAHGYNPQSSDVVSSMSRYANNGLVTFDLADIYGPAEDFVGAFKRSSRSVAEECQFFTKWVPRPQDITREITQSAIERSMSRMNTERLDLLQLHWFLTVGKACD